MQLTSIRTTNCTFEVPFEDAFGKSFVSGEVLCLCFHGGIRKWFLEKNGPSFFEHWQYDLLCWNAKEIKGRRGNYHSAGMNCPCIA